MARLPDTDPGKNLDANIFRVMNHAEAAAKGFSSCGSRLLGQTKLDPKLRELVIDAIAVRLDCPYEWSHHAKWALEVGATTDELEALKVRDHGRLGPRERALVEYALKVEDNSVTDADVRALGDLGFDAQEIVELTLVAGFYGMTARFLNAMDIDYDDDNPRDFELPDPEVISRARATVEELEARRSGV